MSEILPSSSKQDDEVFGQKIDAFTKKLTNTEFKPSLYQFEETAGQNYIVRIVEAYYNDSRIDTTNHSDIYKDLEEQGKKYSKKLLELTHCGVVLAPTYFVTGESSSVPTLFSATAKIEGTNMKEINKDELPQQETKEIWKQAEKLLDGLIKYLKVSIDSRQIFLADVFNLRQYVYGNIKSVTQKQIYLVDTEILYPKAEYGFPYQVLIAIVWLRNMLDDLEYKLQTSYPKQRNDLAQLIDNLSEDLQNPDTPIISKELKEGKNLWLSGERYDPNKV